MTNSAIKNFLEMTYDELEQLNLEAKHRANTEPEEKLEEYYLKYLKAQDQLKAITVCFSDLEGRLHMLDYDKDFLLKSYDNLTFDGSSINGFSEIDQSDLRLSVDWGSFRWLPTDVFGPGKVIVFGLVKNSDGSSYKSDMRGRLKDYTEHLNKTQDITTNIAVEIEGFLFQGISAEQKFTSRDGFEFVSVGGYFSSLPKDPLKLFIDSLAEAKRAMGFENEKDHPEVAPSQFELNYKYTNALQAADQIQLYKLIARQIAANNGMTASFLPKPVADVNGNGMHTNISISKKGVNTFFDANGEDNLSEQGWSFVDRVLNSANDLCLVMNSSVNSYRRLDPNYEAPNQIKASAVDRSSMIRVPLGNEKSARIEVRTVSPDAPPYMLLYSLLKTGMEGPMTETFDNETRRSRTRYLPGNIHDSARHFKSSSYMKELLGEDNHGKFHELKTASMDRCPKELGKLVKTEEVLFHHEVTNQYIWSRF